MAVMEKKPSPLMVKKGRRSPLMATSGLRKTVVINTGGNCGTSAAWHMVRDAGQEARATQGGKATGTTLNNDGG
jgi:hypothetical protein